MNIAVVGTGYVGLVAGVCFADAGHRVTCVDRDVGKIERLRRGLVPIFEPGLEELLRQSMVRLAFTTDLASAVQENEVIVVAVGTPEGADGDADLAPTMAVVRAVCAAAAGAKTLVLKSTVPVGTARAVSALCRESCAHPIDVVSNPEFLKEGAAIDDFLRPDRVVIGRSTPEAEAVMRELYDPFLKSGKPILFMDNASAEMTKYAANAFLSVKISFINELANLADALGADVSEVRRGFTSDSRINPAFFHPGVGFGGSCFPKDVKALVQTGKKAGVEMRVVRAADEANERQKQILFEMMSRHFGSRGGLGGRTIAVWGLAFKPRTDDVRESPALRLIEQLHAAGARVRAYDPIAHANALAACAAPFECVPSALAAVEGADALAIVTEWNEFRAPDLTALKGLLREPTVFDGRNVLDPARMASEGFAYYCIGRQTLAGPRPLGART